jgi:hypothetical protein
MTDAELGSVLNLAPVYDHVNIARVENLNKIIPRDVYRSRRRLPALVSASVTICEEADFPRLGCEAARSCSTRFSNEREYPKTANCSACMNVILTVAAPYTHGRSRAE